MFSIDTKLETTANIQKYILSAVTPRPIAFASTINKNGSPNLSPYSFFNAFSANPPILIFSAARRISDNSIKHTFENIKQVKEVVIGIATGSMAQQVSLSSSDYKRDVDEFEKAGFNKVKADIVTPFLIKESPINFECKVEKIISLGKKAGAGNLFFCRILKIHISETILDSKQNIDPFKLNALSRHGGSWYGKTTVDSLFKLQKPINKLGIGFDNLPESIKNSNILTGSDLAILASIEKLPIKQNIKNNALNLEEKHILAKQLIQDGKINDAWQLLL